ncbi:rRNA processing protein Ipi1 [Cordyceps javanica]|uniref:Pre-rRNA-processing protein n=1 Tax=Cordyceps javanica TaxID=43265 RepID=A0A545VU16_9HYPO|nr:rRNA processing protein Ipi1 [Cordyceps javanica]TQW05213.1 rRNA processing protein Ipi1 [Cordyceps javanica]
MGSSMKKKKEKQKDFQVFGKAKAKASNFTDTTIVMGHQSLSTEAPDVVQQFKHNLSLASSSRSDKQRKDALAYLTGQLSLEPPVNPVGTAAVLAKLVPLISDSATPVRQQLLKLLRVLPGDQVAPVVEHTVMFLRAGMTHLSGDISNDALAAMDWLLDVAGDELVTCPGGWVRTLTTFCAVMGWAVASSAKGWTSAANTRTTLKPKDAQNRARQIATLARFLQAGLRDEVPAASTGAQFLDNLYRAPRSGNAFEYLNLFTAQRDEDAEMYPNKEARQQIFHKRFLDAVLKGIDQTKKEGGVTGRAAVGLEQVLAKGMNDFEVSTALDTQDLLDLW